MHTYPNPQFSLSRTAIFNVWVCAERCHDEKTKLQSFAEDTINVHVWKVPPPPPPRARARARGQRPFYRGWQVPYQDMELLEQISLITIAILERRSYDAKLKPQLRQDPPWFEFLVILTFLHHGIEEVERHLLWKLYKKIRRKSWSNVPPKLVACIGFLYKVVHKIGRLRKFNRSRGI